MRWRRWALGGFGAAVLLCAGFGIVLRGSLLNFADALVFAMEEPDWSELESAEQFRAYLLAHPDHYSLLAYTVDERGAPVPSTVVSHLPGTERALASTVKIVVLSALARAVDDGAIDPSETVSLREWESWYLAGTDGGAHPAAYDDLGIPHRSGVATDPEATATVEQIAHAMIRYSDNAATDWLNDRLGDRLDAETALLGHPPIDPFLEAFLRIGEDDPCAPLTLDLSDPTVRRERVVAGATLPPVRAQRDAFACVGPQGSAQVYATVAAGVVSRTHISPAASTFMGGLLDWPMEFPGNQEHFDDFGTKGGALAGVITEASYLVPRAGPFAGQRRVVVVLVDRMRGTPWLVAFQSFAHQDFLRRMATEPDFAEPFTP